MQVTPRQEMLMLARGGRAVWLVGKCDFTVKECSQHLNLSKNHHLSSCINTSLQICCLVDIDSCPCVLVIINLKVQIVKEFGTASNNFAFHVVCCEHMTFMHNLQSL
jgi:hypothetical protein